MSIPVEIVGGGIDWPAWVQAVGSVAAILVAVWLGDRERRRGIHDRRRQQAEFAALAVSIARQAEDLISDVSRGLDAGQISIDPRNFSDVCATMDMLPLDRMPTAEFVLAYVNIRRGLSSYGEGFALAIEKLKTAEGRAAFSAGLGTKLFNAGQAVLFQVQRLNVEAEKLGVDVPFRAETELDRNIKALKREMQGH